MRSIIALFLFFLLLMPLAAQDEEMYYQGLRAFREGEYSKALDLFRQESEMETSAYSGDALFWAAKSSLALEDWDNSSLLLDRFLISWPDSRYYEEAQYLRGRIFFLENEFTETLEYFVDFVEDFPHSPYVPNALFWMAESLFQLGRVEEARAAFQRIVNQYPDSYKIEAARYRLSLLGLSSREAKLMELLRWSHEEFLKSSQENLQRKQEYEEALRAYQQQILSLSEKEKYYSIQLSLVQIRQEALEMKEFYLNELGRLKAWEN